ncbi:hypothetical protein SUNI508_06747 [Seiridium unicorne]|uniref:Transcription factor domain-containing protein n=1 Tax=Seiridium unicorne TaxID=138068 RepID=A0ABR2UZU5_9PEZI
MELPVAHFNIAVPNILTQIGLVVKVLKKAITNGGKSSAPDNVQPVVRVHKLNAHEKLYEILRNSHDDDAAMISRRIRSGEDVEQLVRSVQEGDLLLQLSLRPEWKFRYDFPSNFQQMPSNLSRWPNPYLESKCLLRWPDSPATNGDSPSIDEVAHEDRMYVVPYHAAGLADHRLDMIDLTRYTTIVKDKALLRSLLEIYLLCEHPFDSFFHADVFLDDLTRGEGHHCAPVLINAVLAAAWHGYRAASLRAQHWRSDDLGYQLLAESKRLLELEQDNPSIAAVQAAATISLVCVIDGVDKLGWRYLLNAIEMGHHLRIFTPDPRLGDRDQLAVATTAWHIFNWQSWVCWHTFRPPLLKEPPSHPLTLTQGSSANLGEIYIQYPGNPSRIGMLQVEMLYSISELHVIIHRIGARLFGGAGVLSLDDAYSALGVLESWYCNLPEVLSPKNIVLPNHLKLQFPLIPASMQYFELLISIFDPHKDVVDTSPSVASPKDIIGRAKACFETLLRMYYIRHGFEAYDYALFQYLAQLAFSALRDSAAVSTNVERKELQSTQLLCAKGLWDQGKNVLICQAIFSQFRYLLKDSEVQREIGRSLPEGSAADLLATIRDNRNDAAVLSNFKASSHGTPYSTASEWESGLSQPPLSLDATLETELMAQYPCAYPALVPILASDLARSDLLGPISGFAQHGGDGEIDSSSDTPEAGSATPGSLSAPKPSQESDYYDERLRHFKTGFWTDVDIADDLAARIISLYLTSEHPLLGFFEPRLFLDDLLNNRERFCSRLLFHSLMHLSHLGRDKDHCVLYYAKEVRNMGIALNLFGADAAADTPFGDKAPDHNHIASCYAAWGGFNWTVLVSLFYRQPGSEKPAAPPKLPIPGEESLVGQDLDYPMKPVKEFLMGTTFPALCRFWRIVQRTEWIHYPDHDSPPENFKQELMEYNFREVIAWTHTLPRAMLAHQNSSHHVIVFHIWLHTTIMDILRPHIGKSDSQRHRMRTFAAATGCPDDAYTASVNQLKRLVINYRSNHQASTFSILWQNGLLYLANATLRDTRDPEWRLYFLLCINGYEALRRPYPMSGVMIQSLLSMTLLYTDMMGTEARRIMDQLNRRDLKGLVTDCEDNIRATFMADLALASKDPEAARVENLAGELEHLVAFKDFVASDAMDI